MRHRKLRSGLVSLLLVGLVAACGSSSGDEGRPATRAPGDASAFPVTITHKFGTTTIKHRPVRVVAIGGGDMETAISLGVVPTLGADWFGFTQTRTWVKSALHGAKAPELINATELPYEKIAASDPDLILYVNSRNEEAVYRKLDEIAPTIAADPKVKNAYGESWQDQLSTIAKATGTEKQAKQVRARTESLIDKAKKANPEFAGKTITAGVFSSNTMSAWLPSDPRMRLLQSLGFTVNQQIAKLDNGDFYVSISSEKLDLMNADLLFIAALDPNGKLDPGLADNPVYAAIPAVKAGHVSYWSGAGSINTNSPGGNFSSALSIGGPLGIAYSLPRLIPLLQKGLGAAGTG